jgi:hypothetical protein
MLIIAVLVALLVLLAFGLIASLNWLAITAAVLFAATLAVAYAQHRRHHVAPTARHSNVTDLDPNAGYRNGQLDDPHGDQRTDT